MSQEIIEQLAAALGTEVEAEVTPDTDVPATEETSEVQPNETELRAREQGWKPKTEYEGDPEKWVDAGEFVRRGELFEKINTQHRELRELRKVVEGLTEHNRKLAEAKQSEKIDQLKLAKKMALDEGDTSAAVEIDDMLIQARQELKEQKAQTTAEAAQDIHPAYWDFTQANPWYTKDRAMTAFADALGRELAEKGMPTERIFKEIALEVRKEFAHKFGAKPTVKAGAVDAPSPQSKAPTSKFQPTNEERTMAKMFARQGIMTEQEYYDQLRKAAN